MTAEEFVDALAAVTGVAPEHTKNDDIFVKGLETPEGRAGDRPFVRASLVEATPLMRTLGRPNREQVVTTRLRNHHARSPGTEQRPIARRIPPGRSGEVARRPPRHIPPRDVFVDCSLSPIRDPTPDELSRLAEIAGEPLTPDGLADALWCVVMLPEFQLERSLPPPVWEDFQVYLASPAHLRRRRHALILVQFVTND